MLSDREFRLGADDGQASPEESPGWTAFRHDVWMDTAEVTQAEYSALLGRNPSSVQGDLLPVTDVSWYDAVLLANARSRRDGLDSVYEYVSLTQDPQGNATNVQGLTVHLDRTGWRLPTEAEWEAAARAGTSSPYAWGTLADSAKAILHAWFQKNSGGGPHAVASLRPNAWGLHDMTGNVMEWTNDWKGPFPQSRLPDYAGLEAPADIPDVPLKGGAFHTGLSSLRPSSRSSTYPAYRSSRAAYVGFRLARGGFTPSYTDARGVALQAPPVTVAAPDLASRLGAVAARLVFLNRANGKGLLSWIDFAEATPMVRALPDPDPVFHPVISPDGQWVAWSTALEGSTGTSRIKARRLARNDTAVADLGEGAIPRFWVQGTDTLLIRAEAMDNTAPGWNATSTRAQKWSGGRLVGEAQTWVANGSYHDGRSGDYLYSGYRRLRRFDVRSGASRILFTAPANGKAAGDTSQVCNASVSPDGSGRVLFLDFGYDRISSVAGRPYGIHEIAFIADSMGRIAGQVAVPEPLVQWDHLEWSNAARWAVSSALDGSGAASSVHLIDLQAQSSTKILQGQDLWQPSLWVGARSSLPPELSDSVGNYNSPQVSANQEDFAAKTALFWGAFDSVQVMLLGHSRMEAGVLPRSLSYPAFNWGFWGGRLLVDSLLAAEYVLPRCRKLRAIVLSLEAGYMFRDQTEGIWQEIMSSQGFMFDTHHGFWRDSLPENVRSVLRSRRWGLSEYYDSLGEVHYPSGSWGGDPPPSSAGGSYDLRSALFASNWRMLEATIADLSSRGLECFLVEFPQSPLYQGTPYAGKYGPTWGSYDVLLQRIRQLESRYPRFHFLDFHQGGNHGFESEDFINEDHLAQSGAQKLTRKLDSAIVRELSP